MRLGNRSLLVLVIAGILGVGEATAHIRPRLHRHHPRRPVGVIVVSQVRPAERGIAPNGAQLGVLDMKVKPKSTEVWVDGTLLGTCDAFDGRPGKLKLPPGLHRIRLVTPDGINSERDVRVHAGVEINVELDLR